MANSIIIFNYDRINKKINCKFGSGKGGKVMSEGNFRGSAFGGFNRKDVVEYISNMAKESNDLKAQRDALKAENETLKARLEELSAQNDALASEKEELSTQIEKLKAELEDAEALKVTVAELQAKLDENSKTVSSYEQIKGRLSTMEIEACKRAEEIEAEGRAQYNKMMDKVSAVVASLKNEYEQIRSGTAVTAAHLCGEMNRMGERIELVNLVLEKTAKGFDELDGLIEENKKG